MPVITIDQIQEGVLRLKGTLTEQTLRFQYKQDKRNPFMVSLVGIAKDQVAAEISSAETYCGKFFEGVVRLIVNAEGSVFRDALASSEDFSLRLGDTAFLIQLKAGPKTMNSSTWKKLDDRMGESRRVSKNNNYRLVTMVGYLYGNGSKRRQYKHIDYVLGGYDFFEWISGGNPDLYQDLYNLVKDPEFTAPFRYSSGIDIETRQALYRNIPDAPIYVPPLISRPRRARKRK